jgi:hypothetical protein
MSFVPWFVHVVGLYALISKQSYVAALNDIKTMAAELLNSDLSVLDSWPLEFEAKAAGLSNPEEYTEATWNSIAKFYARTGHWSRHGGPDPMSRACKCPKAILERYNINLVEHGE